MEDMARLSLCNWKTVICVTIVFGVFAFFVATAGTIVSLRLFQCICKLSYLLWKLPHASAQWISELYHKIVTYTPQYTTTMPGHFPASPTSSGCVNAESSKSSTHSQTSTAEKPIQDKKSDNLPARQTTRSSAGPPKSPGF